MRCPRCGEKTRISDTRYTKGHYVRRMHTCSAKRCRFMFPTREVEVTELERLQGIEASVKMFASLLSAQGAVNE